MSVILLGNFGLEKYQQVDQVFTDQKKKRVSTLNTQRRASTMLFSTIDQIVVNTFQIKESLWCF